MSGVELEEPISGQCPRGGNMESRPDQWDGDKPGKDPELVPKAEEMVKALREEVAGSNHKQNKTQLKEPAKSQCGWRLVSDEVRENHLCLCLVSHGEQYPQCNGKPLGAVSQRIVT